ncbi:hypothetical protein WJX74_007748 [Apatococcus lobatus]|uniref:Uncharacterized protein n=1 Tax=Apatococcus lobatus TaxID=904363 RepID=A0AAW1SFQ2_9CHLO
MAGTLDQQQGTSGPADPRRRPAVRTPGGSYALSKPTTLAGATRPALKESSKPAAKPCLAERESRGELEQLRQRHRQEEAQAIADIAQQYNKRKAWEMGLEMEARKLGYQAAKAARAAAHWNAVATIRRDVVARSRQIGQAA